MKTLIPMLVVVCGLIDAIEPVFAQTWTQTSATNSGWESIASSADGSRLVAVGVGGVYTSTNSGTTWIQSTNPTGPAAQLIFTTLSADGNKIAATCYGDLDGSVLSGSVFISTNFGVSWTSNTLPCLNLIAITCSSDGNKLVVAAGEKPSIGIGPITGGLIYISTNSGADWNVTGAPSNYWSCVASSADGTKLAAGIMIELDSQGNPTPGQIYVSTNAGVTWSLTSSPTNGSDSFIQGWVSIACSADGCKLVAAAAPFGSLYTSSDSGSTWISNNVPLASWTSVASSADGARLVAVAEGGEVYTSTNFGATWISNSAPNDVWMSVASSADGGKLAAAENSSSNAGIYNYSSSPSTRLNIKHSAADIGLSWLVSSTNFMLQQNLDLNTSNWMTLTNAPTLNLTNLQDEVTLSPTNSSGFFRLVSQ